MDDLLQEFIAETRETLQALAGEIVAWESTPGDRARLDAIFRFVHTVKGSCGFLDLPRLARMSHAAEDALSAVRDGLRAPDTALVNAVLAVVDRIGELVEAIDAGAALDDSSDDLLIAALAEDAKPAAPAVPSAAPRAVTRSVRLNVDLLDRMMGGMSDMVLARNELARRLRDAPVDPAVEAALERLSLTVAEMRDTVTRTRMQKIDALFSALPRMVRDTAAELGKAVQLHVEGSDVELDREMIEMMRDPLVHIIRNAVDHGLETPAGRRAAGKRETGHLRVCARQSGNQIVVEVSDDGQGIDTQRLIAKAASRGTHTEQRLMAMSEQARLDLVFEAGLSSRDSVTATSGRGVGMDVVRANIEQIGGRIALANLPGHGLTITIQVPLTLSIMPTIIVRVGDQRFALARQAIEEIVRVRNDAVRVDRLGETQVVTVRGRRLPLVALGVLLGITGGAETLAIIGTRDGDYALAIDEVLDTEELVVKPAAPAVMATGVYAGQCLPDSGLPMLLLDGTGIAVAAGLRFDPRTTAPDDEEQAPAEPGTPALLFDDLDGQRRVIALAAVDRVEPVAVDAIRMSAGRLRLITSGNIVPLHAVAPIADRSAIRVLRLTDGSVELAYAIDEAIDIVDLPAHFAPAHDALGGSSVIGVVMIDGSPVELVDPHALFAREVASIRHRPLCLLHGDDTNWMESFLKPVLEASGYRCTTKATAGEPIAATLSMQDDCETPRGMTSAPFIRLRRDRHGDDRDPRSIYRYDRQGLMAELARQVGNQAGGGR